MKTDLVEILDILLKQKPKVPLHGCVISALTHISQNKSLLLKSFNHLTDVLNNPEHSI